MSKKVQRKVAQLEPLVVVVVQKEPAVSLSSLAEGELGMRAVCVWQPPPSEVTGSLLQNKTTE